MTVVAAVPVLAPFGVQLPVNGPEQAVTATAATSVAIRSPVKRRVRIHASAFITVASSGDAALTVVHQAR